MKITAYKMCPQNLIQMCLQALQSIYCLISVCKILKDSQEPWSCDRWSVKLHRPYCYRFALYNIRKIRPFLSEQATQLLVQALVLSRLDYCNALLAGLPACTIKPLQLIQNAAARVVFNEPKKAHVTPLFIRLHWLPIAARIKFKVLMFAYKTTTGAAPIYLNLLVQTYAPSRSLRSASERCLVVPSQRGTKSLSRTFSWTVPSWWNDLPISIRTAESLAIFKKHLKTHLFRQHLTN